MQQFKVFDISLPQFFSNFFLRKELPLHNYISVGLAPLLQLIRNIIIILILSWMVRLFNSHVNHFFQPVIGISELLHQLVKVIMLSSEYVLAQNIMFKELLPIFELVIIFLLLYLLNAYCFLIMGLIV